MSHKRSFGYMSTDELYVKKTFDEYRLKSLKDGIIAPVKQYGFDGLDESLFVLANSCWPGKRAKKEAYYENQISIVNNELALKPNATASDGYRRLLEVDINPATFNVLKEEREKLRLRRIVGMREDGESLYLSEYARNTKRSISDKVNAGASVFGKVGEFLNRNFLIVSGVALLALVPYELVNWNRAKDDYSRVASIYINSHEVGVNALPLKRDIPEQVTYAVINLTHTNEVTIDLGDDNEFTIPEKHSDPQAGRNNVNNMRMTLKENISDKVTNSYKSVSESDKQKILAQGKKADAFFESAYNSLAFASSNHISYPVEEGAIVLGNNATQRAVDVMESYIPTGVVSSENDSHRTLTMWKWLTYISAGLGALCVGNGVRNARRRSVRSRYY